MTANIHEPGPLRSISKNSYVGARLGRRPLAFRWVVPDCDPSTDADEGCTGLEPPLQNGWAQPTDGTQIFAFRKHSDGSLEFAGHLDASGATSGTVAVTIPGNICGEENFLAGLDGDQYWDSVITPDNGATFQVALFFLELDTGDVTITWPAT